MAANVGVALAATIVALALSEAALRMFATHLAAEPVTGNQYQFYRYDPQLGWSNQPGARGTFERGEFSYELKINSHGMRGPEIDLKKPAGTRRIAVLGDSFTWGIGASDQNLYTTIIEERIANSQVLNFGVSGYSPVQYHLQTKRVLEFEPDVVVIAFCLGNDFADSVFWQRYRYYKPFARLDDKGELVIDGYPIPNVKRFPNSYDTGLVKALHDRSYLFRLLDKTALGLVANLGNYGQRGPAVAHDQRDIYAKPSRTPEVDYAIAVNTKLFAKMVAAYRERGIPVIVLAVPTKCEFGACFPDLKAPTDLALRALVHSLEGLPVVLVDPTPRLTIADFWAKDGHWRPSGHRKVAGDLVPAILEQLNPSSARLGAATAKPAAP